MAGASIEAPYAIASLPNPLDSSYGRMRAVPVYGLKASRKRKRNEVAIGIDGEGVNIYNVQNHNLITSYALPPRSYLCCPPSSIYNRATTTPGARRSTYVVMKDGVHSSKRRLVSFTEGVKRKNEDNDLTGPARRECKLHDGEIVSFDVIPFLSDEQSTILANYRNGSVEFVSGDLSKTHWEDWLAFSKEGSEVEHATVMDFESARDGILKAREDIVALLEQSNAPGPSATLSCRLVRTNEERWLELYAVQDQTQTSLQRKTNALQLIMSYELPTPSKRSTNPAQYELHQSSGMLYQLLEGKLNIYDLSSTLPKLVTELGGRATPVNSFARVASSSVLTFSKDTATLFETSFATVQATASSSKISVSGSSGKKRKRGDPEKPASFSVISTFAELGLVVGLSGTELVAFQLNDTFSEGKRSKPHGSLLSDVIGRGKLDDHGEKSGEWKEWTAKIDSLVAKNDIEELEKLVANDPKLGKRQKLKRAHKRREANALQNGDAIAYEDSWPRQGAIDPEGIDKRRVLYILSKIFDRTGLEDGNLTVLIQSPKLLEWLALTGYLCVPYLEKAIQMVANEAGVSYTNLESGEIMTAIRQIDDNFQLMHKLVSLPVHWEAAEVVQALRLVINSFDTPNSEDPLLALPAPPQPNGDVEMTNGDINPDIELESKAAQNELDFVTNALTTGLEVRSDTLRVIILRLHAFSSKVVTATIRLMMSRSEIIFFIHILRIELADGGWTSQYVDAGEGNVQDGFVNTMGSEEERTGPSDQAIRAIGDLLNCAVDAIGTSGWLVGQGSSADTLIDSLKVEVGAGLEGCYEASTLGTILTELERCAASVRKSTTASGLYGMSNDEQINSEKSLLPLGSRTEPPATLGRNENGKRKSKMAIGREKSKLVGKYSFDSIRI